MPTDGIKPKRIAVVHDWLLTHRGGERVLEAVLSLFPSAEVHTLFYRPEKVSEKIRQHSIHASTLSRLPGVKSYYRYLLPVMPLAVESLELSGYELVISLSHSVAKGAMAAPGALHLCYSFTPMRYAWDRAEDYFGKGVKRALVSPLLHYLRQWDSSSAARVDAFATLSKWVQGRISRFYRRDSTVIFPFVDLNAFRPGNGDHGDYYLIVSGFSPNKRIDLAIETCKRLKRRLILVGEGQLDRDLRRQADHHIEFLGAADFRTVRALFAGARAFLFPGEEDFGITALESMASGRPVIALARGGVTETVVNEVTGLFFDEPSVDSMADAISRFESRPEFSPADCRSRAEAFSRETFLREFSTWVEAAWRQHQENGSRTATRLSRDTTFLN